MNYPPHFNRIPHLFSARPTVTGGKWQTDNLYRLDTSHEKNIPAQRTEAQAHPRFPLTHGNQGRPRCTQSSSRQGPQGPVSVRTPLWVGADASFGKSRRLLKARDYSRVFDGAEARASHRYFLLLARTNNRPGHRLGLVVAKKNVRLAVQRNRVKRVTREVFRQLPDSEPALDVILLARRGLDQLDNDELSTILQQQWLKLISHTPVPSNSQDS